MKKVNCGDWHLGWGLSGNDKIGKLEKTEGGTFIWKGHSQGRHGQRWNTGAMAHFEVINNKVKVISRKGSIPRDSELIASSKKLL